MIACVYFSPSDSTYIHSTNARTDYYSIIQEQTAKFINEDVFICGDLNSRTGQLLDYYESIPGNDGGLSYIDKYELIVGNVQKRSSRDLTVNEYGSNLINFCKSSGYRIMNGKLDNICNTSDFTCYKENGASVAD